MQPRAETESRAVQRMADGQSGESGALRWARGPRLEERRWSPPPRARATPREERRGWEGEPCGRVFVRELQRREK